MAAIRNQERVKSILLLAIHDEYLLKFYNVADAKSLWEAIKSRFGGNVESKKMQKNVLKHQFENFSTASNESLDKAYDRFQKLISQLEVHGTPISKEDINQKFLRSLPSSWNQIALIMINKPDIDEIDIDDLYNNLRVYKDELKRSSGSNSASQNLAFLSSENTGTYSFFAQPTTSPQLENEDFQQVDGDDLEELDLQCQRLSATTVTEKGILIENVDLEGVKEEDLMVTIAGAMHQQTKLHHRHCSSSSSDSEVQKCSKQCLESFKCLQKNDDTEREKHKKAKLEIRGYEIALESLESRILGHEKNELAWGEKYEFQNYELKCREIKINNLNLELEKAVKERDELKDKIEKWEESSKNLDEILNSQIKGYKAVPPPITGNFLTLRADISFAGLDGYAIRNKIIELQTSKLNNKTSETTGQTNDPNTVKPKSASESVVSNPKINNDRVIIEDWPVYTARLSVSTVRPSINTVRPVSFVRPSFSTARPSINTAKPVSSVRPNISNVRPSVSTTRPAYASRPIYPRMDNVRPRGSCSPIKRSYYTKPAFRPKDLKQDVKTFGVKNMTTAGTRAVVNTGKGKLNTDLKRSK
ncbi:hypothetical protein Tco_0918801 [Tanacetum coccineum]